MNKEKALKNQGLEFREDILQRRGDMSRRFPAGLLFHKKLKVALLLFMPHFFILLLGGKEHERNQSRTHSD